MRGAQLRSLGNASPTQIASANVFVLGITDFLLHLCLHTEYHLRLWPPRLIWWCDIVEVLERHGDELNWDYLIQVARDNQLEGSIYSILSAINEGANGRVPADVLRRIGGHGIAIRTDDLLDWDRAKVRLLNTDALLSVIKRIPSFRGKIHYCFRILFPSKRHIIYRYSERRPKWVYVYYIFHMGKLIVRAPHRCLAHLWNVHRNTIYQRGGKATR